MDFHKNILLQIAIINILLLVLISLSHCNLIEANLKFTVEGNGFHRSINYEIDTGKFAQNNCYVALNLHIPSSLYVNNDELADSERLGNITACSTGETDVEIFAEEAKSQELTICNQFNNGINILNVKLHQRYQRARDHESYVNVTLPNPKILLGCRERIKEYPVSKIDICESCAKLIYKWREIPYHMKSQPYTWVIPVGKLSQRNYVTWITLFACALGTILIVKSLWHQN
ncbi:hypothetical protein PV327_010506 [Microctonus hyperodae]|uniref:Phosphatidylinositol-glycan biosynthesis class X protein n=1 Tax=Microctonus hyperodae TaxID=165561 RepID=A0AA39KV50_MICHY|nr:hypothetical protein PV327_010506 [Microctonus hyperodae]